MLHCLIIDDQDQEAEIKLLNLKSKEQGLPVTGHFFNITDPSLTYQEIINGKPEILIDVEKVIEKLKAEYGSKEIDLIACDYEYDDRHVDGLNLIQSLKGINFKGKKMPYIIYSNNHDKVQEKLQLQVKGVIDDKSNLMSYLETYFDSRPNSVSDREKYYESIIEFLKKNKTPMEIRLQSKLLEYPEKHFDSIFPRFKDKKLKDLAKMVEHSTEEADAFEYEFLERAIAHFIYLEE